MNMRLQDTEDSGDPEDGNLKEGLPAGNGDPLPTPRRDPCLLARRPCFYSMCNDSEEGFVNVWAGKGWGGLDWKPVFVLSSCIRTLPSHTRA